MSNCSFLEVAYFNTCIVATQVLPLMNTMERLLESPEEWEVFQTSLTKKLCFTGRFLCPTVRRPAATMQSWPRDRKYSTR